MDDKLFQYAPGLVGFGSEGKDGSSGETGLSFYFSTYDGLQEIAIIKSKIDINIQLNENGQNLPDNRSYISGDTFLDVNGRIFEIDLSLGNRYKNTGMALNSTSIFEAGPTQSSSPGFTRYSNLYKTDKILIDSIYGNDPNSINIYTNYPDKIYDNTVMQYGKINFINDDIVTDLNNVFLFNVWSTGLTNDDAIALVKEGANNIWHLGNKENVSDANSRNIQLDLDFQKIQITHDLSVNNNIDVKSQTTTYNLTVRNDAVIEGDLDVVKNVTIGVPGNLTDKVNSYSQIEIDKGTLLNPLNKVTQSSPSGTVITNTEINTGLLFDTKFDPKPSSFNVSRTFPSTIQVSWDKADFLNEIFPPIISQYKASLYILAPQDNSTIISFTDSNFKPLVISDLDQSGTIDVSALDPAVNYKVYIEFSFNGWKRRSETDIIFSAYPTNFSYTALDSNDQTLTVNSGNSWTATADQTWINQSMLGGTGIQTMDVSVDRNYTIVPRSGTITLDETGTSVPDIIINISQDASLYMTVSNDNLNAPGTASSIDISVYSNTSNLALTNVPAWITPTLSSTTGDANLNLNISLNPDGDDTRNTAFQITGNDVPNIVIDLLQAEGPDTLTVIPTSLNFDVSSNESQVIAITTNNDTYNVVENDPTDSYLVSPIGNVASGTNITVTTKNDNISLTEKDSSIVITAGTQTQIVTFNQLNEDPSLIITESTIMVPSTVNIEDIFTFSIISNTSGVVTVTQNGVPSKQVISDWYPKTFDNDTNITFEIFNNSGSTRRYASFDASALIEGIVYKDTVNIIQYADDDNYISVTPQDNYIDDNGGDLDFSINVNGTEFNWTATASEPTAITFTDGSSGSGDLADYTITVSKNLSGSSRNIFITFDSETESDTITINQGT